MQDKAKNWDHFWLEEGQKIFASACTTTKTEQLGMILRAKKENLAKRPTIDEMNRALVNTCSLGHEGIVEMLLQEKADVNAVAAGSDGRTALQAAAGGHLVVVEPLLQEKADVNTAGRYGRTALRSSRERLSRGYRAAPSSRRSLLGVRTNFLYEGLTIEPEHEI